VRERAALSGKAKLGLLVTFLLLALGWAHTFSEMWLRWFPAWERTTYSLGDRLTKGDSYYTHGPMVPLVSLVIAIFIYKRVGVPVQRTRGSDALGWTVFLGSLLLHVMSVQARVTFVSGFALIGVLAGLILLWGGIALLRAYWLPIAFLAFMVPLPMDWIAKLNYDLKFFAGRQAIWLTDNVFGVPVVQNGAEVLLPNAPDGTTKKLVIENVCGGLRSLISLVCFAALFALICRAKGFWRIFMLLMAVPVAIETNVLRITSLNVVAHHWEVKDAGPDSPFHDWSGIAIFAVALGLLFGLEQLILQTGKLLKKDWADTRLLAFLDKVPRGTGAGPAVGRPMALASLALVGAFSVWGARTIINPNRGTAAAKAVPAQVAFDNAKWTSRDFELDQATLDILETNDYVFRRYSDPKTARDVDLLIVFSPDNRKGTHPPEVCLEGGGDKVIAKREQRVQAAGMGDVDLQELVTQKGGTRRTYHVYVYKCGDSYTPSFFMQQMTIFFNGLVGRNAAGALIRVTVPVDLEDVDEARALGLAAAEALLPEIDKGLP
jgi:EpsI family protein